VLSAGHNDEGALLWRNGAPVARAQFLGEAASIARQLPPGKYLLNLCEQREAFLLAFVASLYARRTQLMPAARGAVALADLAAAHPGNLRVTDDDIRRWRALTTTPEPFADLMPADVDPVLVGFTSGTTGRIQPHSKRWRALAASVRLNSAAMRSALGVPDPVPLSIVGTVPPHHIYGIEFTVLLPLFANMTLHAERPLFPADVAAALSQPPRPRVLVSTPLHLRALAESGIAFPALDLIVSATAPLDRSLAGRVEERLGAPLLEIFGSTETCAFATRRTVQQPEWQLYEGVDLDAGPDATRITASWFEQPQLLQDVVELRGDRRFVLLGRNSDLVEVAGKRASLADITRRLCAIPGVDDAVAFQPEAAASGVANRIAALVVSRTLSAPEIARHVAGGLDAALVPRPLLLVERIPRDPVGKVSRARLLQLTRSTVQD
jgi:acyl-coenzyme A synthetase/AMP-(fatty) acid ligase